MYWMLWTSILFGLHRKFLKLILFTKHSSSDKPRVSKGKKKKPAGRKKKWCWFTEAAKITQMLFFLVSEGS